MFYTEKNSFFETAYIYENRVPFYGFIFCTQMFKYKQSSILRERQFEKANQANLHIKYVSVKDDIIISFYFIFIRLHKKERFFKDGVVCCQLKENHNHVKH